jgi:hypothetical protein
LRSRRCDRIPLADAKRTAAGVLVAPASVSRTGLQEYRRADGTKLIEFRPAQEVFAPAALESLRGAVVTIGHVAERTPLGVGLVSDRDPTRAKRGDEEYVETSLLITDQATIALIELPAGDPRKLVEISLDYSADLDMTPGLTPAGKHYDATQRNLEIHSAALLTVGQARAGKEARIRLDGHEELCSDSTTPPANGRDESHGERMKIKIGDKVFEEGGAEHISFLNDAITSAAASGVALQAKLDAAIATGAAEKARADGLELAASKRDIGAEVSAELAFRDSLRPLLGDKYDFAGKSRDQVKRDAIGADACRLVDAEPEASRPGYLAGAVAFALSQKKDGAPVYNAVVADGTQNQPRKIGANAYADAHKEVK